MATDTSLAGQALLRTAREIAEAVGGRVASGDAGSRVVGVSTDSRTTARNNLFVALSGEKFDGHTWVDAAVSRGAAAVLVSDARAAEFAGLAIPVIGVAGETLVSLGMLGRSHRDGFKNPVIGITGSAGKSTAKEMTAAVLAWGGREVLKTEGNLNNRIGVPLTVMGARPSHSACVVEMGISFPGEMNELVKIAMPDVRVALNAGLAHIEFLKDADGVAAEKATIFDHLRDGDTMIWNADDPRISREAGKRSASRQIRFGHATGTDVRALSVETTAIGLQKVAIEVNGTRTFVALRMVGEHHVTNVLAAAAVGVALGVPLPEIVLGLETRFHPVPGRGDVRLLAGDVVLFDDTYNANPTSTSAALRSLAASRKAGRRRVLAALGDMLELGDLGPDAHARIGAEAAKLSIDGLYLFGELSKKTADAATAAGMTSVRHFTSRAALADALLADLAAGDGVLAKGSRSMKMDEVVAAVVAKRGGIS